MAGWRAARVDFPESNKRPARAGYGPGHDLARAACAVSRGSEGAPARDSGSRAPARPRGRSLTIGRSSGRLCGGPSDRCCRTPRAGRQGFPIPNPEDPHDTICHHPPIAPAGCGRRRRPPGRAGRRAGLGPPPAQLGPPRPARAAALRRRPAPVRPRLVRRATIPDSALATLVRQRGASSPTPRPRCRRTPSRAWSARSPAATPASTGVYYDDSYNHALLPAGHRPRCAGDAKPGVEVTYFELADKDPLSIDAGQGLPGPARTASSHMTSDPTTLIDPPQLPVDPSDLQAGLSAPATSRSTRSSRSPGPPACAPPGLTSTRPTRSSTARRAPACRTCSRRRSTATRRPAGRPPTTGPPTTR